MGDEKCLPCFCHYNGQEATFEDLHSNPQEDDAGYNYPSLITICGMHTGDMPEEVGN